MTEWHIMTAAALYNDAGPNHVNAHHAAANRFGQRIAPGFLTTGLMMGVIGRHYGWSIETFLESHVRFLAPVYVGALLSVVWEVTQLHAKEAFSGGIVTLRGWCWSGDPERLAVDMDAKIALNDRAAPPLHALSEST
jgi:acyl dehydratase